MVDFNDNTVLSLPYTEALVYVILGARDLLFVAIKNYYAQKNNLTLGEVKSSLIYLYYNIYKFMEHSSQEWCDNRRMIANASKLDVLDDFVDELETWLFVNKVIQVGKLKKGDDKSVEVF